MLVQSNSNIRGIEDLLFIDDAGVERGGSTVKSDTTVGAIQCQHTIRSTMVVIVGSILVRRYGALIHDIRKVGVVDASQGVTASSVLHNQSNGPLQ